MRMSAEHQKYSTDNQIAAITHYATERGFVVVRTYADEGKSGLRAENREALRCLIDDVENRRADFEAVLVFDVSRWGRFQDTDESAYYEFICKAAGIAVHYCAEQFENDGSLAATIIKSMKRAMAGEYSRELSAKVFAGQRRLVSLGFRVGGTPGYGLRRQLIDETRKPKAFLTRGERKSLMSDRVILVPGPKDEIEVVRRMYRLFVVDGLSESEIATAINEEGRSNELGEPWNRWTVHQVLTNEKYVGNNVYNRRSTKLRTRRIVNPPEAWVRAEGVFGSIVERAYFDAAQRIVADRARHLTSDEMLDRLRYLFKRNGWLSRQAIDESENIPSSSSYRGRFGTLLRAYQLIGYVPRRDYRYVEANRALRRIYSRTFAGVVAEIEKIAGSVEIDPLTSLLIINDEFSASLVIIRCRHTRHGRRWAIRLDTDLRPDITIVVRLDASNREVLDYYLFPRIDLKTPLLKLKEDNSIFIDAYRSTTLEAFYQLGGRTQLGA